MVNIYELLNRIIVNKRYSLSSNLFIEADRSTLSEKEKSIFDLLKNIVSLGTEHPVPVPGKKGQLEK